MRHATNTEIQANIDSFDLSSDVIMTDILKEHRAKTRPKKPAGIGLSTLLEINLANEVGKLTPPVRIYHMADDGTLVLKEQIQATTFRRRALESIGGKGYRERLAELKRKRQKAGLMSKTKSRAARLRAGLVLRQPIEDDDEDPS